MRYTNNGVTTAKKMLISRMSYLIALRLKYITVAKLAREIEMSPGILYKLRDNVTQGISYEAVLEAARRLKIRYTLIMEFDGVSEKVKLDMEDIASSRVRTLGEQPHLWDHRNPAH